MPHLLIINVPLPGTRMSNYILSGINTIYLCSYPITNLYYCMGTPWVGGTPFFCTIKEALLCNCYFMLLWYTGHRYTCSSGSRGSWGLDLPLLTHDVGFLTLGRRMGPLDPPFAWRPHKLDPPFQKSRIRPWHVHGDVWKRVRTCSDMLFRVYCG